MMIERKKLETGKAGGWRRLSLVVLLALLAGPASGLEWQQGHGYRRAALPAVKPSGAGFTHLPSSATGIHFTNALPMDRYKTNQILLNGSGVAAGDIDGDGHCDLYFCGLDGENALYRNLGGWRFEDVTARAGVGCPNVDASGAVFADLDGDHDLDLVVNTVGSGTFVFYNDGKGQFRKGPSALNAGRGGTSLALGDLDGDGFLDLYVANYRTSALMDMPNTRFFLKKTAEGQVVSTVNGRPASDPEFADRFVVNARGGIEELGEPDALYRNIGGTNFMARSLSDGSFRNEDGHPLKQAPLAWGLSVAIRDINQDGRPDIYVCNDFDSPDEAWINQGDGKFRALSRIGMRKSSLFSMGIDFADINRDGFDDFLVLDMLALKRVDRLTTAGDRNPPAAVIGQYEDRPGYMMNTLFLNRGDGTYAEIAHLSGLAASDWSWAASFLDVDLDGWEDVLISNGHERAARHMDVIDELGRRRAQRQMSPAEILEQRKLFPRLATANLAFRNRGDLTFEKANWGFDYVGVSHGIALADLDNDGDLDVAVNHLNDGAGLYRNDASQPRVAVRLRGSGPNTFGIGARITVEGDARSAPLRSQSQEMMCGGKYLSCDEPMRVFAAAGSTSKVTIHVRWPSGKESVVSNAVANSLYEVLEEAASARYASQSTSNSTPLFTDVTELLGHRHSKTAFDDFARQPLLPEKLSQLGPGVSWADVNSDNWDDLIVSAGRGGHIAVLTNESGARFKTASGPPLNQPTDRDTTTVLAWKRNAGETVLLAGWSNYEVGTTGNAVRAYNLSSRRIDDSFPRAGSSTGPLAMADVDGDGDLDLFVGSRTTPGKYPEAGRSMLLRNDGGRFVDDATNAAQFADAGMISGAVFSDIDSDHDPDLLLACDWGPVKIFRNTGGVFSAWDPPVSSANSRLSRLSDYTGWWTGISTADFDGDNLQDIVVSNWGRNTEYERYRARALELWTDDLEQDGVAECMVTYVDEQLGKRVPFRGLDYLGKHLPFLRERYPAHEAFAKASMDELFPSGGKKREAAWLESTVFLRRGQGFEAIALPVEAQMAPSFGICAADFSGDGIEDIFLAQNFFARHPESPRLDAGIGVLLLGQGQGKFMALAPGESGLRMYGEQRGCAAADFDGDGRLDLAVGQNGAETRLFRNTTGRAGLRVRLVGPAGNPDAVGALVRVGDDEGWGILREVRLGSGYWSAESPVQVMGFPRKITRVQVRWPGARVTTHDVPPDAKEITLRL